MPVLIVGECMIDFPIATRNPSFANSWIYLPDSIIRVDVKHRQPTGDLQSLLLYTKSWGAEEPRKTSHMHSNQLVHASSEKC